MNMEFSGYTKRRAKMIVDIRDSGLSFEDTIKWFKSTETFTPITDDELISWLFSANRHHMKNDREGQRVIKKKLSNIFNFLHPYATDTEKDTFSRDVRNWLGDDIEKRAKKEEEGIKDDIRLPKLPIGHAKSRERLIWITFAFELVPKQANQFLNSCGVESLYPLDLRDAAFIYCLQSGKTRIQAEKLIKELHLDSLDDDNIADSYNANGSNLTQQISEELQRVTTDDSFRKFVAENRKNYRKTRQAAIQYVSKHCEKFMDLAKSTKNIKEEIDRSETSNCLRETVEKLAASYGLPVETMNRLYRAFCVDWLTEAMVHRIENQTFKSGVKRPQVLIAYILTDGTVWRDEKINKRLRNESPEITFNESFRQLNGILQNFGFSRLDPRDPFDWLVLYCLRPGQGDGYMKSTLENALNFILN